MKTIRKSSIADIPPQRIFIGVAGGSAAGKTTLCETINRHMAFDRNFKVEVIGLDSFYKSLNKDQVDVSEYNFDHPLALDFDKAYKVLKQLQTSNQPVQIPKYCFKTHQRLKQTDFVHPANIILFQGLMAFYDERIRNLMTYKIFINCDDDIRLCRRLKRDTTERQRTVQSVLSQYNKFVKNAFRDFVYPTITYADLIIPGSRNNRISVDFIVQHIKNMARKINLFEKAYKTKIFLFGENEYFDKNTKISYDTSISYQMQSFMVFPTSEEHRKQLQFFMNYLMSESFSLQYFKEIYVYQFMKIARSLLRQLIDLKGFKIDDIEIISIYECGQKLQKKGKSIRIIFTPFILENNAKLLNELKKRAKVNQTIILLNFFCDMRFPNLIYQSEIDGLIFINLFLIPNKNRFLQIINSNNINLSKDKDTSWFISNNQIIKTSLNFVSRELKIKYDNDIQKQYEQAVQICKKQNTSPYTHLLTQRQYYKNIEQIPVLRQQHENLCGFHALNNIKQNQGQLLSKKNFIETFQKIQNNIKSNLGYSELMNVKKFQPLQRKDVNKLLQDPIFQSKQICCFYISQSCITNSPQEKKNLIHCIDKLKQNFIDKLHIIVGSFNHYFILCLQKDKVYYLDSLNTPLIQLMQQKVSVPNVQPLDYKRIKDMKSAIEIINNLYMTDGSLQAQIIKLGINSIIGQYNKLSNDNEKKTWLIDEYPAQVLRNDFLCYLEEEQLKELSSQDLQKLQRWLNEKIIRQHVNNVDEYIKKLQKIK